MKFKKDAIKPGMVIHCPKEEDKIALSQYLISRADLDFTYTDPEDEGGYFFYVSDIDGDPNDVMNNEITEFSDLIESEPRFKVGDKVRIRKDLQGGKYYGGLYATVEMAGYRGKTSKISKYHDDIGEYYLQDFEQFWNDEMLEPVDDSPNEMSALELLEWLRKAETKEFEKLFSVGDIEEMFDYHTNDEIIRIITAYEATKKAPKPVEVETGWLCRVYNDMDVYEEYERWEGDEQAAWDDAIDRAMKHVSDTLAEKVYADVIAVCRVKEQKNA